MARCLGAGLGDVPGEGPLLGGVGVDGWRSSSFRRRASSRPSAGSPLGPWRSQSAPRPCPAPAGPSRPGPGAWDTRMENICINDAKRRQWKIHMKETQQILTQCQVALDARKGDGLSRGDFSGALLCSTFFERIWGGTICSSLSLWRPTSNYPQIIRGEEGSVGVEVVNPDDSK